MVCQIYGHVLTVRAARRMACVQSFPACMQSAGGAHAIFPPERSLSSHACNQVDGAHEFVGEDHTSMKLALISRGLQWLVRRACTAAQVERSQAVCQAGVNE